jgi:hypothetical protein
VITTAETLAIHSIEGLLTPDDITALTATMDALLAQDGRERYAAGRSGTRHEVPGHNATDTRAAYEPAGRLEIHDVPDAAGAILDAAIARSWRSLTRVWPWAGAVRPWMYIEYEKGQYITPHLDNIAPDPLFAPRQLAGISVLLTPADSGGNFYVETTADQRLWTEATSDAGSGYATTMSFAHDGADHTAAWFRSMRRTRWTADPQAGDALVCGSQITHGTTPVAAGRVRKFLTWLLAQTP